MHPPVETRCCIAGGGPAGMMLGFLLARAGVDVYVLEKHSDFLRDFRGDTIHPSTLELMHELGILEELLRRPHQEIRELSAQVGRDTIALADFTHLPTHCRFVVLMPQWDFLNFVQQHAARFPNFHLKMNAEVTGLLEERGAVVGCTVMMEGGVREIRGPLTVGADGRRSVVRARAGLKAVDLGAPMDVMWMRLSRRPGDPEQTFGHVEPGRFLVMLNRETYWQCAYVISKGEAEIVKGKGLPAFRAELAALEPFLRDRVDELQDWRDVSLLTVTVDRLERWARMGLLCIGDAAHAMSPIGGVGINLAIQDAVAAANLLAPILRERAPTESELNAVQRRRNFPTNATQRLQLLIQNRVISRVLKGDAPISAPWPLKLLGRWPFLRRIPARVLGVGFRPEHVKAI